VANSTAAETLTVSEIARAAVLEDVGIVAVAHNRRAIERHDPDRPLADEPPVGERVTELAVTDAPPEDLAEPLADRTTGARVGCSPAREPAFDRLADRVVDRILDPFAQRIALEGRGVLVNHLSDRRADGRAIERSGTWFDVHPWQVDHGSLDHILRTCPPRSQYVTAAVATPP
jgi:hypothetical protein